MNTFLPDSIVEIVHRLAIGLEPLDSTRPNRIARPLEITVERPPTRLLRSGSGRYKILYAPDVETEVEVLLVPGDRRYVPRRMSFSIATEAAVRAAESAGGSVPAEQRVWRPRLFPGANYDVSEQATGFRGRVTRAGVPVRWTRVVASLNGTPLGLAHGDDRGEFLLLLGPNRANVGDLDPLNVKVSVRALAPPLPVDPADPLADLKAEPTFGPGVDPEKVLKGTVPPSGYALLSERAGVPVRFGRISSLQPFAIP